MQALNWRGSEQQEENVKGRQSGMPDQEYWSSFFNSDCILSKLDGDSLVGEVLEFGCGYGLFTEAVARRTSGTVYALDIDPQMVQMTQQRMTEARLFNVMTEERDFVAEGCGRPDQSISYAMLFNILHIENPVSLLKEAYRAMRPGGKVAILHWNYDSRTPRGPSMEIRPRPEWCQKWAIEAGFQFVRHESLDCCRYHYGLVVQRPTP